MNQLVKELVKKNKNINQEEETIKEALKPAIGVGKITLRAGKKEILEKLTPQAPGEAPSLKRKILEGLLEKTSR